MDEKMVSAIIQLVEKGGAEGSSLLKLYIWLNSPMWGYITFIAFLITLAWGIPYIAKKLYKLESKEE